MRKTSFPGELPDDCWALCAGSLSSSVPRIVIPARRRVEAVGVFLQIARLCTTEHDRISEVDESRRERTHRWSEVHEEFEAFQREGRPMRSDWSWECQVTW